MDVSTNIIQEVIQRLTKIEVMFTNHLAHHERFERTHITYEQRWFKIWITILAVVLTGVATLLVKVM